MSRYYVPDNCLGTAPETNEVTGEVYPHYEVVLASEYDMLRAEVERLTQLFDRHAAREQHIAEIVFQHVKHGDETHQQWLRNALIEVLCREDTNACQTFDALTQQLAALRAEVERLTRERDVLKKELDEQVKVGLKYLGERNDALIKQDELSAILIAAKVQPQTVQREIIHPKIRELHQQLAASQARVWEDHKLRGRLWSFFRLLLSQGGDIQLDYNAGKYNSYEEYAARLDAAARERLDEWLKQQAEEAR